MTGAAGFLGSHLCDALAAEGARVFAVTRRTPPEDSERVSWLQADCADAGQVRAAVERSEPEVIFHMSSSGIGSPELSAVLPTLQSDLVSCVNLLTVATELGVKRTVLAASLEEPTHTDQPAPSPYAAAKWCSSAYARMFHALFRTPVALARVYMSYGPRQRAMKVIPSVILSLLRNRAPELGSGKRLVDWVYVADVVEGLLTLATAEGVEGKTLDFGSGSGTTIREVVELIVRLMESPLVPRFGARPDRPGEIVRIADSAATEAALGWRAATPLAAGLTQTIAWYDRELAQGRI